MAFTQKSRTGKIPGPATEEREDNQAGRQYRIFPIRLNLKVFLISMDIWSTWNHHAPFSNLFFMATLPFEFLATTKSQVRNFLPG